MPGTLQSALLFLVQTLFDIYLIVLFTRVILVYVRANYFNPLTQFIVKCTDFIVKPLKRIVPNYNNIEFASILLFILLEMIKILLLNFLEIGAANLLGLFVLAMGDGIKLIIQFFTYAIIIQALISWFPNPSPLNHILYQITSPVMRPIQKMVPPIGGFDISPIPALILLQLLIIVLVNPIMSAGLNLAYHP